MSGTKKFCALFRRTIFLSVLSRPYRTPRHADSLRAVLRAGVHGTENGTATITAVFRADLY